MESESAVAVEARLGARALRAHPFATLFVVAVLVGGGLRLVPTSAAAMPGSNAAGGAASTACAAK